MWKHYNTQREVKGPEEWFAYRTYNTRYRGQLEVCDSVRKRRIRQRKRTITNERMKAACNYGEIWIWQVLHSVYTPGYTQSSIDTMYGLLTAVAHLYTEWLLCVLPHRAQTTLLLSFVDSRMLLFSLTSHCSCASFSSLVDIWCHERKQAYICLDID